MLNVYSAEMYRLKKSASFYLVLVFYAIIIMVNTIINAMKGNSIIFVGQSNASIFLAISIVGVTASTFESNTLKNILASGNSRADIYRGKFLCALAITVVYIVISFVAALVGYGFVAVTKGGVDLANLAGDGNIVSALFKLLLVCCTLFLYSFLFFGLSMLTRTVKASYNICIFVAFILPLVQMMIAKITEIQLFDQIHITVDVGVTFAQGEVSWTAYLSLGIFVFLGILSNLLAYVRMKRTEA